MSFSSLVSDIAYRSSERPERPDFRSQVSEARSTRSYASTAATSVSITGDIKSQLHGGYSHPLSRAWQAEKQLTKVCANMLSPLLYSDTHAVNAHLPSLHL
jgi:porphobilinogen synthase